MHTCEGRQCINSTTQTLDWPREGGAVKKHAKSGQKHPKCSSVCEGWSSLQKGKVSTEKRTAEIHKDGPNKKQEEAVGLGVYILINFDENFDHNYIAEEPSKTTYKLLFVQDKRMKKTETDILQALSKHGSWFTTWLQTTLDNTRWGDLEGHPGAQGFIFLNTSGKAPKLSNKVSVCVDEWVGLPREIF